MPVIPEILAASEEMATWRRKIHAYPVVGFEEVKTAEFVSEKLESWGIEVHRGIGRTGVVGVIHGDAGSGTRIGLRAELDALAMNEEGSVPHRSRRDGLFHGCGHDGHTVSLLGAARHLSRHRDFKGTVHLIFQPAEETLKGAKAMIEDGLFDRFACDEIYALHNMPSLPAGTVGVRSGPILSAGDTFRIVVDGIGGHGAVPHKCVDPIVVGAHLIQALQSIVSRSVDPLETAVISVGVFRAGTSVNVIPSQAEIIGTVRTFATETRTIVEERMRAVCDGLAVQFRCLVECAYERHCPATVNDPLAVRTVITAAPNVVGADQVRADTRPEMPSEDFSFMLERVPGAFFFIGQGGPMCHHPEFDFDDAIAPVGASVFAQIVKCRLGAAQ
jgi:hippurate hydrolase